MATWVGELSAYWSGARISSACQWNTALLMGPGAVCVDLPQAHTLILWLPPSHVRVLYDARERRGYDGMFWSMECENDTQEGFFLLVQIGLVGLLPCIVSGGLTGGGGGQQSRLASAPSMVSIEEGGKYLIVVERMIPEGMNYSVLSRYPLSRGGECLMCRSERFSSYLKLQSQKNLRSHEG